MAAENHIIGWEKFQRIIAIASGIFGMITPIAIFWLGRIITSADERRQEQNHRFDILDHMSA
jgi:hypothetical protein